MSHSSRCSCQRKDGVQGFGILMIWKCNDQMWWDSITEGTLEHVAPQCLGKGANRKAKEKKGTGAL